MITRNHKEEIISGLKESTPILVGYIPIGLAFGILAKNTGLSNFDTSLMSILVFAGASQFIAIGLIEKGITAFGVILTTFLVNSRHILMSASLSPHFKKIKSTTLGFLSFGITDETFALNSVELEKNKERSQFFVFGVHLASYLSWSLSTIAGVYLSNYISNPKNLGLGFALPAMFIALLVLQVTEKIDVVVIIASVFLSLLMLPFLSNELLLIFTTIIASTIGAVIKG